MELEHVVPWGRSFSEYKEIFTLSKFDINQKILGCGDGPASFNAELTKLGGNVVSIDPVYQFSSDQIRLRIDEVYPQVISQVEKNQNDHDEIYLELSPLLKKPFYEIRKLTLEEVMSIQQKEYDECDEY